MSKKYSLDEYVNIINNYLETSIGECAFGEDIVHNAMKYSLGIGGKRIRPILVLEFCRLCGGNIEDALPFAATIEMIHTYSLIHDDLPCMDDDDMRRGMPSCHKKYGEEYALLAGDGLLTRAFGMIAESAIAEKSPKVAVKAIAELSALAGVNGMIGGQVVDLRNEDKPCSLDVLQTMDSLKTGALIKCAAILGVLAAEGTQKEMASAVAFAENLGHAFQIIDDILDVIGDEKELGKPIGSDADSKKSTYVSILGIDKSKEYADELTEKAMEALECFGADGEFLRNLALSLISRKN